MSNIAMDSDTRRLMKELKLTQTICMVSSVLILCLLGGGIFLFGRVRELAKLCEPVVERLSVIDVESLNNTLEQVNASLEEVNLEQVADTLEQVAGTVEQLDVEALNAALEGLDAQELSESLRNLNDASEKIREIGEKINSLFSSFSEIFFIPGHPYFSHS